MICNIFAAFFASELEPGQKIKIGHGAEQRASAVIKVEKLEANPSRVRVVHELGTYTCRGTDLINVEVER